MTDPSAARQTGLLGSLATLTGTLLAIAQRRLDLLANDLDEERAHLLLLLVALLTMLFCLGVAVVLAVILVAMLFWDSHRLSVLALMTALFLIAGAVAGWLARRRMKTKPRLFAASLAELRKDQAQLDGGS